MKKLMLGCLLSLVSLSVVGQTAIKNALSTKNTNVVEVLNRVNQKFDAFKSMKMDVTLLVEDGTYKEVQKATIYTKSNQFRIESSDLEMMSDGKTQWVYLKKQNKLQTSTPDPDAIPIHILPYKLLKSYRKDYTPVLADEKENHFLINFSPKSENCMYTKIMVTINKEDSSIQEIKILEKSGVHYTISVMNLEKNPDLNDDFFVYQKR